MNERSKDYWKCEWASGAQIHHLRRLRPDIPERILQGLTKGQASNLLDACHKRAKKPRV